MRGLSWRNFDFLLFGAAVLASAFGAMMIRSAIAGNENLAGYDTRQVYFALAGAAVIVLHRKGACPRRMGTPGFAPRGCMLGGARPSTPRFCPMSKVRKSSRRDFLKTAGAAVAVPCVFTSAARGNADRPPPSDRIVMAGIGGLLAGLVALLFAKNLSGYIGSRRSAEEE